MKHPPQLFPIAFLALLGALLGPTQIVNGAVISAVSADLAKVAFTPPSFPPSYFLLTQEGNDDADSTGNVGSADLIFHRVDAITLNVSATNSTSTQLATEYILFAVIKNQSAVDWEGIQVRLLSTMNNPGLAFDTEAKGSGITEVTLGPVVAPLWESRRVRWDNTPIVANDAPTLTLLLDVPNSAAGSNYDFELSFEPIVVPEPAGFALLAAALGAIANRRPRR